MNVARSGGVSKGRVIALCSMLLLAGTTVRCASNAVPPRKDPCTTVYAGQCGAPCTVDTECPAGLHCGGGTCTALCGGGVSLCGGGTCSPEGRCLGGSPSPTGTAGSSGGPLLDIDAAPGDGSSVVLTDGADCPNIDLQLGAVTPTVVLLIDQSGSMETDDLTPGVNRWMALKTALTSPGNVVQSLEAQVRFGFAFYSNDAGNQPPAPGVCPTIDTGGAMAALMPPALNNYAPFSTYFPPLPTYNNTPTGESIKAVADLLAAFPEPGPKYIVLATDGEPDRCENANENEPGGISRDLVISNVQVAYQTQQISTFVISVGSDIALAHLNDVANAGQGFPIDDPTDRFFVVNDQAALTAAFQTIIGGVRDCTLSLNGRIDPAQAATGTVTLDGVPLPMDPVNGWTAGPDGMTIIMNGTACDAVKANAMFVTAKFPCQAVLERPK